MHLNPNDPEKSLLDILGHYVRVDDWLRGHEQYAAADLVLTLKDRVLAEVAEQTANAVEALLTIAELGGVGSAAEIMEARSKYKDEIASRLKEANDKAYGEVRLAEHIRQRDPVAMRHETISLIPAVAALDRSEDFDRGGKV
jgi:hypothetical protein